MCISNDSIPRAKAKNPCCSRYRIRSRPLTNILNLYWNLLNQGSTQWYFLPLFHLLWTWGRSCRAHRAWRKEQGAEHQRCCWRSTAFEGGGEAGSSGSFGSSRSSRLYALSGTSGFLWLPSMMLWPAQRYLFSSMRSSTSLARNGCIIFHQYR